MTLVVGESVGDRFTVERELGPGLVAPLFLAREGDTGREVVIEALPRELSADAAWRARFEREARVAMTLSSAYAARVLAFGTCADGAPFVATELVDGEELSAVLAEAGSRPVETTVDWLLQALEPIAEAHARGLVHGGLTLRHLVLVRGADGGEVVKVRGLGVVTERSGADEGRRREIAGAPAYSSPEQVRSASTIDARSDQWSLGVCLYELLTGASPFDAGSTPETLSRVLVAEPTPPSARSARVPRGLSDVVLRCLAKEPSARWPDLAALAGALEPFGSERSAGARARVDAIVARAKAAEAPPAPSVPDASAARSAESPGPEPRVVTHGARRGRQLLFGGGAVALAFFGFLAVRSILPEGEVAKGAEGREGVAPEDSIEELFPPPPPEARAPADDAAVEMTFDVDASSARGRRAPGPRPRRRPK